MVLVLPLTSCVALGESLYLSTCYYPYLLKESLLKIIISSDMSNYDAYDFVIWLYN